MIAVPQGEEKHLLNLSDLYHEIGHLIFIQSETFLTGEHLEKVKIYFNRLAATKRGRKDGPLKKKINNAMNAWENTWSEELACDLIATYLVGPAYGWSHMKICAVSSGFNNIYSHNNVFKEHPADEIRMRVILKMLVQIGCDEEAGCIQRAWNKFLEETHNERPTAYDLIFPQELIDSITENVYSGSKNILLHSYPEQKNKYTRPISLIVNEAWTRIRNEHNSFAFWETEQIENIWSLTF
jgi:hypothetical protein